MTTTLPKALPADLLAPPQDVTEEAGLLHGRLYRVLYATSAPANKTQAACGIVAVPETNAINSILAVGHGADGLLQECQNSMFLDRFVGGKDENSQGNGPLFTTLKTGGAYVAPDYPAAGAGGSNLQPIGHGIAQGLSMLDAARVLTRNPEAFGLAPVAPDAELPLVVSGFSQGGGVALWAGQLARYYFELQGDRTLNLAGVIAYEAAGTQYVASPQQPRSLDGFHLADRITYWGLSSTIYMSWLARSWSQIKQANSGAIPFGPTSQLPLTGVLTKEGLATSSEVVKYCSTQQLSLGLAAAKYQDPDKHRLFESPVAGSKRKGAWTSAFDATCLRTKGVAKKFGDWCKWLQFNTAGPNGINPFPKYATDNAGAKVPVYLVQGTNDELIWCVDNDGAVDARNCVTAQFYDSLAPEYCEGQGYLRVDYYRGATHGDIFWNSFTDPTTGWFYVGSAFERFVSQAFSRTLPKTCAVNILEPTWKSGGLGT